MKLTNLTAEPQMIKLKDYFSRESFTMSLTPYGFTDVEEASIENAAELEGKVLIGEKKAATAAPQTVIETPIKEEEETAKEEIAEAVKEEKTLPDKFVCDICGAEFASARGLSSHKNKAHAD